MIYYYNMLKGFVYAIIIINTTILFFHISIAI